MPLSSSIRNVFSLGVVARIALGWGAFIALSVVDPTASGPLPSPALVALLVGIVAVIVVCAFGVVAEAEHLARRLGDPYGTLVLTLSIVLIEVILISAVMLGPGDHATIARDSVMAVTMIILNLVVGVALIAAGLRHTSVAANRSGVSTYLSLLVVLLTLAFVLPGLIGVDGAYPPGLAIPIAALTVLLYAFFLVQQTGRQRADFQEVALEPASAAAGGDLAAGAAAQQPRIAKVFAEHRTEIGLRALALVITVVPIVVLSHDMATLLDDGLERLGAPVALSGVLIALIVFLPETITTIRAALQGEMQRVSNLCHGALVSTVGLTIPSVLVIGLATGQPVVLAESPTNMVLLGVSLLLTVTSFSGKRVTALHGAAHLLVFVIYGMTLFV